MTWGVLSVFAITALVAASNIAFNVLRLTGVIVLIGLGDGRGTSRWKHLVPT